MKRKLCNLLTYCANLLNYTRNLIFIHRKIIEVFVQFRFTMSRCFILLLIISQLAKINTICGLELTSSLIEENVNQRDDVAEMGISQLWDDKEIVYLSNQSRGRRSTYENVLFQNGSQYPMKATGENNFCRAPDGQYLPIDLFALDTCARCYHYIPDNPSFFHRNSKWNPKVVRVQSVQTAGTFYNVTFLVHNRNNLTASKILPLFN